MLNRCEFIGNLGTDPETKQAGSTSLCKFRIAVNEKYKDQEKTEWVSVVAFGKTAEVCGRYLSKGRQVYVAGRLQTRDYEKDGQKRYFTEVVAEKVLFLGKPNGTDKHPAESLVRDAFGDNGADDSTDEIPF